MQGPATAAPGREAAQADTGHERASRKGRLGLGRGRAGGHPMVTLLVTPLVMRGAVRLWSVQTQRLRTSAPPNMQHSPKPPTLTP
eukprot:38941-Chlamydomonas_euryale.AAC.1